MILVCVTLSEDNIARKPLFTQGYTTLQYGKTLSQASNLPPPLLFDTMHANHSILFNIDNKSYIDSL